MIIPIMSNHTEPKKMMNTIYIPLGSIIVHFVCLLRENISLEANRA